MSGTGNWELTSNQSSNDGDITMSEGLTSEALEDFNRRRNVFNSQITIINNEIETVCALLLSNIESSFMGQRPQPH